MNDDFREYHWALENIKLRVDEPGGQVVACNDDTIIQEIQLSDQVYVEDLHRQRIEDAYIQRYAGQDTLRELIENVESSRPTYTISDYVNDIRRKYKDLGVLRLELEPRDIVNIKVKSTSYDEYPVRNFRFNFGSNSSCYEDDMFLMKGLCPAEVLTHSDNEEDLNCDEFIDASSLRSMLREQI